MQATQNFARLHFASAPPFTWACAKPRPPATKAGTPAHPCTCPSCSITSLVIGRHLAWQPTGPCRRVHVCAARCAHVGACHHQAAWVMHASVVAAQAYKVHSCLAWHKSPKQSAARSTCTRLISASSRPRGERPCAARAGPHGCPPPPPHPARARRLHPSPSLRSHCRRLRRTRRTWPPQFCMTRPPRERAPLCCPRRSARPEPGPICQYLDACALSPSCAA